MSRPRLLDLGCKAGIASDGLVEAGFDVTGVDIKPQPHYPYPFIQDDMLIVSLDDYDAFWASPPCQGYSTATRDNSRWVSYSQGKQSSRLIDAIRFRLLLTGKPYVIENVSGARPYLKTPFTLCGVMFGLPISRHRYFETNFPIVIPEHTNCKGVAKRYSEGHDIEYREMSITGKGRHAGCSERWKRIMRINREVSQAEIVEAIPEAYSTYIGKYLIQALTAGDYSLREG